MWRIRASRIGTFGEVSRMIGERTCSDRMDSLPAFQSSTCRAVTSAETSLPLYRICRSELWPLLTIVVLDGLTYKDSSLFLNAVNPKNMVAARERTPSAKVTGQ